MSSRPTQSLHSADEKASRSRCLNAICFSWKVLTCIVSHVTLVLLVVSYCVGGAYLFQYLEKPHELEIKRGISYMRKNLTDKIWKFSDNASVLSENDWVKGVTSDLANFESKILTAMKKEGWDGDEDIVQSQWTFAGSLFYSIIVITTIGYGHISPRTNWGKVTTIFYAIVGIPLMLLCLSNIGDIMATSFRFTYWRVCCFFCTRASRHPRNLSRHRSKRRDHYSSSSRPASLKRSKRITQRSIIDSGILSYSYSDPEIFTVERKNYNKGGDRRHQYISESIPHARSTPSHDFCRENYLRYARTLSSDIHYNNRQRRHERCRLERDQHLKSFKIQNQSSGDLQNLPLTLRRTMSVRLEYSPKPYLDKIHGNSREEIFFKEINRKHNLQSFEQCIANNSKGRAKSADIRIAAPYFRGVGEEATVYKIPIISNHYAIHELNSRHIQQRNCKRSHSVPRSIFPKADYLNSRETSNYIRQHPRLGNNIKSLEYHLRHTRSTRSLRNENFEKVMPGFHNVHCEKKSKLCKINRQSHPRQRAEGSKGRERVERLPPSPRILSPMGLAVKRQVRKSSSYECDHDSALVDDWKNYYGENSQRNHRPVPIWLCVFLVISYILGGAALFAYWEQWSLLDSAYFCFITLTTIGFGDFVPAKGVKDESEQSIAYCSLYLLFGIALLAMSFNLVQEEFISSVKNVARRLGILKDETDEG